MATKKLYGSVAVNALYLGSTTIRKCYGGSALIWDVPAFVDEPKVDTAHALANRQTLRLLPLGVTTGMTSVSGAAQVVDGKYASTTAGTLAMHRMAMPAANTSTFRVSAIIKVDKTSGRYSRVGFATGTLTSSPDAFIGHTAGSGIVVGSTVAAVGGAHSVILSEAQCVDGAEYRVTLTYDNVNDYDTSDTNTGKARVMGTAMPVDPANNPADPWYPPSADGRFDSVGTGAHVPSQVICRTNSALGTIRDLYYIDHILGATSNGTDPVDDAPIQSIFKQTSGTDRTLYYSKGKSAPLRIIVVAGGTGIYGGVTDFGVGSGRNDVVHNAARKFWRDLAELGYTVVHANALHEGWGADDHLAKQMDAVSKINAISGGDARIYYIGYSMGGISMWRAIMGRNGFPPIRAAYCQAGISRLGVYYNNAMYSQIKTRWPVEANLDEPQSWAAGDLVARGTRVRMVTSTADTNVPKNLEHDPMYAKFAGSGLATERVLAIDHFAAGYWDAEDCVSFFEGADA